jgi:hypothetical protein
MTDLLYSLLLFLGMAAVVIADDRKVRRQLRRLVVWRSSR